MRNYLLSSEQPFLFAILIGIVSFSVTQITNNLVDSPAIEYDLHLSAHPSNEHEMLFNCRVKNLSSSSSFANLKINFRYKADPSPLLYTPTITPMPPAGLHDNEGLVVDSALLIFDIARLQPGDEYMLRFKSDARAKEHEMPYIFLTTDSTVRLLHASFSTWIVAHYVEINIVLSFIVVILIILYLVNFAKHEDKTHPTNRSIGSQS